MQMLRSNTLRELCSVSFRRTLNTAYASKTYESLVMEEEKYSNWLKRCSDISSLDTGKAIHAKFVKESLLSSLFIYNHLLNMYAKSGDLQTALKLFEEMHERNVVSWSAIIAGLVQHGCPNEALSVFHRMYRSGFRPNEYTLVSALNACSLSENSCQGYQIYAKIVQLGFESNVFLTNSFLTALIRHGKLVEAAEFFEKCPERDIVSWNAMIAGYLQLSYSEIPSFWYRMNHDGVRPDNFTFATVLTGLASLSDLKMGLQVHAQLIKYGHGNEICVGNSLVDMYLKNRNLIDGSKVFDEMPEKDVVSWTQIASGCLQCGAPREALRLIEEMKKMGVKPNKFTLATALNACANLASLEEGKKAHGLRIKLGKDIDICVDNALLDMYAKCGCVDGAWVVFQLMHDRSVVSWTTMIMGFAQNGHAKEALDVFNRMRVEHIEPNYITFICVLYACSQGRFIVEGWEYFLSMTHEHGITPGEDHYACMVDLLGRAGHIKEAEALIQSMPFQAGVLVWQTLLGACRVHGDMETGKRAAAQALALDKEDPSTYVLLSNIFANTSDWDGVGELRELMEARDVKKMAGSSWIELMGNYPLVQSQHGRTLNMDG
ncbi:putative pentatricopeptide repeat-containing protein At3g15130 [Telopea speciosissima]|uniref:putative pentatricopeptide repeat-containing protein At3g15130 n=1 Tax=Telopea speciosissima TaxID=54955 RepID=UPI001CC4A68E|nr:putative pentatricopeptide repeat-containing protein At3g15130 [Telopea speciosissima]